MYGKTSPDERCPPKNLGLTKAFFAIFASRLATGGENVEKKEVLCTPIETQGVFQKRPSNRSCERFSLVSTQKAVNAEYSLPLGNVKKDPA